MSKNLSFCQEIKKILQIVKDWLQQYGCECYKNLSKIKKSLLTNKKCEKKYEKLLIFRLLKFNFKIAIF